jgi:hypothetical protein
MTGVLQLPLGLSADGCPLSVRYRLIISFSRFIEENKDEITALQIFYYISFREKPTFEEINGRSAAVGRPPRSSTPEALWDPVPEKDRVTERAGDSSPALCRWSDSPTDDMFFPTADNSSGVVSVVQK